MGTTLGQLLKTRREELGYSRTRTAELSGVNASSIEAWEVGRVAKPPLHDVIRLARVLSISMSDLERIALAENDESLLGQEREPAAATRSLLSIGVPLLARAMVSLRWDDHAAARALNTTPARIGRLRSAGDELTQLETMTLIAVLAAFPPDRGGATAEEVDELLAKLRQPA